jgi:hypothetical protein
MQAFEAALTTSTRYVELYHDYASAQGKERQTAFELLMRHVAHAGHGHGTRASFVPNRGFKECARGERATRTEPKSVEVEQPFTAERSPNSSGHRA